VPGGRWTRLTILGALCAGGIACAMTVAAATTTRVFLAFVEQVLLPALQARPGCVVAMDNLAPLKAACVRAALAAAGIAYRYLPPYSPDLVWGFACQALTIAASPSRLLSGVQPAGDRSRRSEGSPL
jgi:DDE superfamily endonuclease